jgi:hypothetical protein
MIGYDYYQGPNMYMLMNVDPGKIKERNKRRKKNITGTKKGKAKF